MHLRLIRSDRQHLVVNRNGFRSTIEQAKKGGQTGQPAQTQGIRIFRCGRQPHTFLEMMLRHIV